MRPTPAEVIKEEARVLGFDFCGISKAEFLEEEAPKLEAWLQKQYQGKMSYLERNFDKRLDPRQLVPGAKSIISLVYNYYPSQDHGRPGNFKIARYAYGQDYHFIIKKKAEDPLSGHQRHLRSSRRTGICGFGSGP